MIEYCSRYTFYANIGFDESCNYVIDHIQTYLSDFEKDSKLIKVITKKKREIINSLSSEIILTNSEEFQDIFKFTYLKKEDFYKENDTETITDCRYYFVNHITYIANGMNKDKDQEYKYVFAITLDVLNTYLSKLKFLPTTHISRRHIDRFNYGENMKNIYKDESYYYFLRHIPDIPDPIKVLSIPKANYCLMSNDNNINLSNVEDMWLKIYVTQLSNLETEQINSGWTIFIPYFRDVMVKAYNINGEEIIEKTIDSYKTLRETTNGKKILYLLEHDNSIVVSMSLSPYPPVHGLRNSYYVSYGEVIDITSEKYLRYGTLNYVVNEYTDKTKKNENVLYQLHCLITRPFYWYPHTVYGPRNIMCSLVNFNTNKKRIINEFFGHYYILKIPITEIDQCLVNIQNKKTQDVLGESSIYAGCYLPITFNYEKINIPLSLETLTYNETKNFSDLCNICNFPIVETPFTYSPTAFLSISCTPYMDLNRGLEIDITDGDFFSLQNPIHTSCHSDLDLPTFTSEGFEYMKTKYSQDKKKIEDDYNKAKISENNNTLTAVLNFGFSITQIAAAVGMAEVGHPIGSTYMAVRAISNISQSIKHMIESGQVIKKNRLNYENSFQNLSSKVLATFMQGTQVNPNNSDFSNAFHKAFISWSEPTEENIKSLSITYKITGNAVDEYAIPTHNNRIFYDYLECQAIFAVNNLPIDKMIIDIIKNKLENGVTFIHRFILYNAPDIPTYIYVFPYENPENMEIKLYNYLMSNGKI